MGTCSSCELTAATLPASAKVIMEDGELREFTGPVMAAQVLQKVNLTASCFVCNADEMEFDGYVTAIAADEELQLGQLYFVLPCTKLRRPLHAEEMAALAVKASAALVKCGGAVTAVVGGGRDPSQPRAKERRRGSGGSGRGRNFESELSSIPEH